jgi:hypothetical protein
MARPYDIRQGSGCPKCAGKKQSGEVCTRLVFALRQFAIYMGLDENKIETETPVRPGQLTRYDITSTFGKKMCITEVGWFKFNDQWHRGKKRAKSDTLKRKQALEDKHRFHAVSNDQKNLEHGTFYEVIMHHTGAKPDDVYRFLNSFLDNHCIKDMKAYYEWVKKSYVNNATAKTRAEIEECIKTKGPWPKQGEDPNSYCRFRSLLTPRGRNYDKYLALLAMKAGHGKGRERRKGKPTIQKPGKSGFKGVCKGSKYSATITQNGKKIWLGIYPTAIEAARAYDAAAKKHYGKNAILNFP